MSAPITRMPRIAVTSAIPRRGAVVIRMGVFLRRLEAVAEPNGERRRVALEFFAAERRVCFAAYNHADAGNAQNAGRCRIELVASRVEIAEHEAARRAARERP